MLLIISLLATACLIVFAGSASAGIVTSGAGDPIEGALVKLVDYPQYNDTTDVLGAYAINNVPYGTYTISASAAGYGTNVSTVVVDSATVTKDFTLSFGALVGMMQINSVDGGGAITSTMGIPIPKPSNAGTSFMGQFENRRATAGWYTAVVVSDTMGSGATLNIDYMYDNGTLYNSDTHVVPSNGVYNIVPEGSTTLESGMLSFTSDSPVLVEKRVVGYTPNTWNSNSIMSTLMSQPSNAGTSFMGQFENRRATAGWFSAVVISDATGSGATITIDYMYDNGTILNSEIQAVPANGNYIVVPEGSTALEFGKLSVTSTSPVVTEMRIVGYEPGTWNQRAIMAVPMSMASGASTELIVPQFVNSRVTDGWFSAMVVSDVAGTGATITIDYMYDNGTISNSETQAVPADGNYVIVPEGSTILTRGKILIHSDNPVIGEMRVVNYAPGTWDTRGIMSLPIPSALDVSSDLIIPGYYSVGDWDSMASVSSEMAVMATFDYYDDTGAAHHSEMQSINANGSYTFYPGNVSKGRLESGKVVISS